MKKIFLLVLMCLSLGTVAMAETNMKNAALPPHIEFRNFGVYGILDYSHYFTLTEVEALPEFSGFNAWTAVIGFQLRKETGIGLGYSYLLDHTHGLTQMPLFVELRSHWTRNRISPFTTLAFGYNFPTGSISAAPQTVNVEKGGINFTMSAGARFAVIRHFGVSVRVGYSMLSMRDVRICDSPLTPAYDEPMLLHNITVGASLNF